ACRADHQYEDRQGARPHLPAHAAGPRRRGDRMTGEPMRRREFIHLLATSAAAWPLAARAQQAAMPVVGYLSLGLPDVFADRLRAFRQSLNEAGFVEGRNVQIEYRWAGDDVDRLGALASDLARRQVAVIAGFGGINGSLG